MLKFVKSAEYVDDYPESDKELLFVGRSNVGKSSLINSLFGQKIAYVGKTPGKTRLLNFFDAGDYMLTDSPGYGYAKRDLDEQIAYRDMMQSYFEHRESLKLVVILVDCRRVSEDDVQMMDFLRHYRFKVFCIATKGDKLKRNDIKKALTSVSESLSIPLSAIALSDLNKTDYKALRLKLEEML